MVECVLEHGFRCKMERNSPFNYTYNILWIYMLSIKTKNHTRVTMTNASHILVWSNQQEHIEITAFHTHAHNACGHYRSITNNQIENERKKNVSFQRIFHEMNANCRRIRIKKTQIRFFIVLDSFVRGFVPSFVMLLCDVWICIENALAHNACAHAHCVNVQSHSHTLAQNKSLINNTVFVCTDDSRVKCVALLIPSTPRIKKIQYKLNAILHDRAFITLRLYFFSLIMFLIVWHFGNKIICIHSRAQLMAKKKAVCNWIICRIWCLLKAIKYVRITH